MINILFVSYLPILRGGQINLLRIADGLPREQFSSTIVVPAQGQVSERASQLAIPWQVRRLESPGSLLHVSGLARFGRDVFALRRFCASHEMPIIYVDSPEQAILCRRATRGLGVSILWHVQNAFENANDRRAVEASDAVVSVSESTDERLAPYPRARFYERIPNAVDSTRFHPKKKQRDMPGIRRLVYVGHLEELKGTRDLLQAFSMLADDYADVQLWLFGNGTLSEVGGIPSRLRSRVHVRPFQSNIEEAIRESDIFVFPSHREGLSLSLLEAMALEMPIVATDIAGNREVIESGVSGLLVPPRSPKQLAAAIRPLLDDRQLATRCGQAARRAVLERYTVKRYVDSFRLLFERMAAQA